MQFWAPDAEHMCSKHVEAWNKLIVQQKFCASSWLITEINILRCTVSKTSKHKTPCCWMNGNVKERPIPQFTFYIVVESPHVDRIWWPKHVAYAMNKLTLQHLWCCTDHIESRWKQDFPHLSRPALGPTQPPVQWVRGFPRFKERPGCEADLSPPSCVVVKKE